ncbi:MAG: YjgN family protein [Betaproteobacteria bacterium]
MLLAQDSAPQASGGSANEPMPPPAPDQLLAADAPPQAEVIDAAEQRLRFTGSGAEYFRIWAVNLTLTVLTLGLYSAWAKVRRLQYFYQHTELDGAVFDYTARPASILFGRLLALVLLVLYYVAFDFSATAGAAVTGLLAVVLPYLLWQSNRFKARNTRYRGLTFGFEGSLGQAYRAYLPPIVVVLSPAVVAAFLLGAKSQWVVLLLSGLGLLLLPFFHALFRRYIQCNLRFGGTRFEFVATAGHFAWVWVGGLALMVGAAVWMGIAMAILTSGVMQAAGQAEYAAFAGIAVGLLNFWLCYLAMGSYLTAQFQRLLWEKTRIGDLGIRCAISTPRLLGIQCLNTLCVILTLGLYRPFAAIRVARYRLECMTVVATARLGSFTAGADQSRRGATGESAAELFDMDVGL